MKKQLAHLQNDLFQANSRQAVGYFNSSKYHFVNIKKWFYKKKESSDTKLHFHNLRIKHHVFVWKATLTVIIEQDIRITISVPVIIYHFFVYCFKWFSSESVCCLFFIFSNTLFFITNYNPYNESHPNLTTVSGQLRTNFVPGKSLKSGTLYSSWVTAWHHLLCRWNTQYIFHNINALFSIATEKHTFWKNIKLQVQLNLITCACSQFNS